MRRDGIQQQSPHQDGANLEPWPTHWRTHQEIFLAQSQGELSNYFHPSIDTENSNRLATTDLEYPRPSCAP